jgi:hypothetical protein
VAQPDEDEIFGLIDKELGSRSSPEVRRHSHADMSRYRRGSVLMMYFRIEIELSRDLQQPLTVSQPKSSNRITNTVSVNVFCGSQVMGWVSPR